MLSCFICFCKWTLHMLKNWIIRFIIIIIIIIIIITKNKITK